MCLYPKFIKNKAYSEQRFLAIGTTLDPRKKYIPAGCGNCYECRKQKAQQWRVRLIEEIKVQKHAYFVTLTFNNEELYKIAKELNLYDTDTNAAATLAVRRFLERWRKKNKKSIKHWLITELGHEGTERIHLHGILFTDNELTNEELFKYWKYGFCDIGQYCNLRTINYIVKYVTKIDKEHKTFKPVILCSAGLGEAFIHTRTAQNTYRYKPHNSAEYYKLPNGAKVALPIYYRNKLYSEKERANLWTDRLDKGEIFVNGIRIRKVFTEEGQKAYYKTLESMQAWNENIGYGNNSKEWKKKPYNITFKMINKSRCNDTASRSTKGARDN